MPAPTGRPTGTGRRRERRPRSSGCSPRATCTVTAASVLGFEPAGDLVDARLRLRGRAAEVTVRVGRVVNCTGPETDLRRVDEPLVEQLLHGGQAMPDPLGLGLQSTDRGELIGADGRASDRLLLVGPLRKGLLWENTAVPELRVEAEQMARYLSSVRDVTGATLR